MQSTASARASKPSTMAWNAMMAKRALRAAKLEQLRSASMHAWCRAMMAMTMDTPIFAA